MNKSKGSASIHVFKTEVLELALEFSVPMFQFETDDGLDASLSKLWSVDLILFWNMQLIAVANGMIGWGHDFNVGFIETVLDVSANV